MDTERWICRTLDEYKLPYTWVPASLSKEERAEFVLRRLRAMEGSA